LLSCSKSSSSDLSLIESELRLDQIWQVKYSRIKTPISKRRLPPNRVTSNFKKQIKFSPNIFIRVFLRNIKSFFLISRYII
jgi:hypothetical protein